MKDGVDPCMEEGVVKTPTFTFPAGGRGRGYLHPLDPSGAGRPDKERKEGVCNREMGYYLRPEGRGCRVPPTYRNLFWAAG